MSFDLYFAPATFEVPSLSAMKVFRWGGMPHRLAYFISLEEQSLRFNIQVLDRARHTDAGSFPNNIRYGFPLKAPLRSAFVKSIVLQAASIVEAVLRALAEQRGYKLHKKPSCRTMGNILNAWCEDDRITPKPDISLHWDLIKEIHDIRNNVHLFKAAEDPHGDSCSILEAEERIVPQIEPLLSALAALSLRPFNPSLAEAMLPPPPPPRVVIRGEFKL
ncbi:hypothetical protein [Aeromonas caviae]|uniref:hypothetical protein n=1 Tax=Aeromonas caviae TaxID=648 RepID=UPI002B46A472|nr:hypothetical protein [Aeromonas caviae]